MRTKNTRSYTLVFYSGCYYMQFHAVTEQQLNTQFYIPDVITVIQPTKYIGPNNLNLSPFSNQIQTADRNL